MTVLQINLKPYKAPFSPFFSLVETRRLLVSLGAAEASLPQF